MICVYVSTCISCACSHDRLFARNFAEKNSGLYSVLSFSIQVGINATGFKQSQRSRERDRESHRRYRGISTRVSSRWKRARGPYEGKPREGLKVEVKRPSPPSISKDIGQSLQDRTRAISDISQLAPPPRVRSYAPYSSGLTFLRR